MQGNEVPGRQDDYFAAIGERQGGWAVIVWLVRFCGDGGILRVRFGAVCFFFEESEAGKESIPHGLKPRFLRGV